MSDRTIGRLLVVVQIALLAALVLLPAGDDFTVPSWLRAASTIALVLGLAIVAVGALALGRALTASPVPNESGSLRTGGPYRFVRHPIYTGVLLIVVAVAARSGNWVTVAVALVTVEFFWIKARWEERRLADRYPGYGEYAARTPRFVPGFTSWR